MAVETKIHFYKDGEDKGFYNVYNGDCDGRDTFWCSLSEWDGLMKLQMVNNEVLYFNGNGEEMFVFEEGEEEYNWIKNYINPKLKIKNRVNKKDKILNMLMMDNTWSWNYAYKKEIKKPKQITYDEQKELIKKLKEKIKELNKGNKRKLKTENNKLKKENKKLKEENQKKWENMADEINDACNPLWNQINELQQQKKKLKEKIYKSYPFITEDDDFMKDF